MRNKNLTIRVIMLITFLLVASTSFAQIETEEELAKAAFETIRISDSGAFSELCISEKRLTKLIEGLVDTTRVVKSVKQDMEGANGLDIQNAVVAKFGNLLEAVKIENLNIFKATFEGVIMNKIAMDIPNLMAKKVKFKISIDNNIYIIFIESFIIKDDMFIYDLTFEKEKFEIKR